MLKFEKRNKEETLFLRIRALPIPWGPRPRKERMDETKKGRGPGEKKKKKKKKRNARLIFSCTLERTERTEGLNEEILMGESPNRRKSEPMSSMM
jgi:hypothetical protein